MDKKLKLYNIISLTIGFGVLFSVWWFSYPTDLILRDAHKQSQAIILNDIASGRVYVAAHFYGNYWKILPMFPKPTPPPVFLNQTPPQVPGGGGGGSLPSIPPSPTPTPFIQPK